ncbi:MAG: hypothetical protein IMW89_05700 [Ktedonobacteraceae bacterium]|nr:hypothetical protein [Ktedonobacteraceae bacterium]
MSSDPLERRGYRRSPGRQYGYDYDPLRSYSERSQSGQLNGTAPGKSGALRPDPRRTRQLLRQQILASKTRPAEESDSTPYEEEQLQEVGERSRYLLTEPAEEPFGSTYLRRRAAQDRYTPSTRELMAGGIAREEEAWENVEENVEEDGDAYVDPLDASPDYADYAEDLEENFVERPTSVRTRRFAPVRSRRPLRELDYPQEEQDYYEEEEEEPPASRPRRRRRKHKLSRRGMLIGLGAAAVAGTGIAAYQLGPKIPQAVNSVGTNIEKQLQDAFNQGVAQGANAVRKEFITTLNSLEGFSLEGAMTAARLTRVAYDVFVSPIVKFGSALTGDFLKGMLSAFKTARGWLAGAYQDNATLQAIQKVLESWVDQINTMPKQLDAITQTDLDGAQAYLRALQRKLEEEKAKLNNPQATPAVQPTTPPAGKQPAPQPTPKPKQ